MNSFNTFHSNINRNNNKKNYINNLILWYTFD